MTTVKAETPYSVRSLEKMGLRRSAITGLVNAGYVTPARGPRNEYLFSFQDVVLLRTALGLQAANVPQRKLLKSLRTLRGKLPAAVPLSGLRITAIGDEVAVREGGTHWEAKSGQLLFDFEVAGRDGSVSFMQRAPSVSTPEKGAADWFSEGESLEGNDPASAEAAYRRTLKLSPDHVYAYVNLGALLCEAGRCKEAVDLYEEAAKLAPDDPLVLFNTAIALEDQKRDREALASYERCLHLAPNLADAHFNTARLCDKLGDARGALRHFSAYRRLNKATSEKP